MLDRLKNPNQWFWGLLVGVVWGFVLTELIIGVGFFHPQNFYKVWAGLALLLLLFFVLVLGEYLIPKE
jgi:hypothetical protein